MPLQCRIACQGIKRIEDDESALLRLEERGCKREEIAAVVMPVARM
jgi:hypothetical protein